MSKTHKNSASGHLNSSTKYEKAEKSNHRYGSPEWCVCVFVCNEDNVRQLVKSTHTQTHSNYRCCRLLFLPHPQFCISHVQKTRRKKLNTWITDGQNQPKNDFLFITSFKQNLFEIHLKSRFQFSTQTLIHFSLVILVGTLNSFRQYLSHFHFHLSSQAKQQQQQLPWQVQEQE